MNTKPQMLVIVNTEEQYSLWPSVRAVPEGWKQMFGPSAEDDCIAYVETHWTDMRPLSLRKEMEQ